MNSRSLGATKVMAWPGAEIAVMGGPVAAVRILHRRKLAATPEDIRPRSRPNSPPSTSGSPVGVDRAIEIGVVDEMVQPGGQPFGDRRGDPGQ